MGGDFLTGGEGIDALDYTTSNKGVNVKLNTGISSGGHAEGDTISNFENIIGSNFADSLTGDVGDNSLFGLDDSDILSGDAGNDTLFGGQGNDVTSGNEGVDVFVLESNSGRITMRDYEDNTDKIGLSGDLTFSDLRIVNNASGNRVIIRDLSNSNSVVGAVFDNDNVLDAGDFTESDFIAV